MKKYALGIVAAVVAIGLSSFSLTSKSNAVDIILEIQDQGPFLIGILLALRRPTQPPCAIQTPMMIA